jgi:hypothetical protein
MGFFSKLGKVFTKQVDDTSTVGKVDKTDMAKVTRTAILVAVAAGVSYVLTNINPDAFGSYGPLITVAGAALLDFLNKLVKDK